MGNQSDQNSGASNPGSGGTTRVSGTNVGATGTTRVSTSSIRDTGTTRVGSAPLQGPDGTTRVTKTPNDIGAHGTTRVGAQPIGMQRGPAPAAAQRRYAPGQIVQINGVDYTVSAELTSSSNEAVTYKIKTDSGTSVLKQYHAGIAMPRDVLERIKGKPHPNVVGIQDFGSLGDRDVEVLEFVEGGTLDQLLRREGPIRDQARLKALVKGILEGLDHLHKSARVIYQDLKPENILLADDSLKRPVLADFGISSVIKPGDTDATVKANGTKEYAAPELARFGNQTDVSVDEKVDYYALGVTLLECWQGKRPFEGIPDAARLRQIRDAELPIPKDIDPELGKLITGLLKPLPKDRMGFDAVRQWLDGKPLGGASQTRTRHYGVRWFNDKESFDSPLELAALLEKYPDKGADYLYLGRIQEWLDAAGDMELSTELQKIVKNFDLDVKHRRAGLARAIYALNPSKPFITAGERQCRTAEEVGDAFLLEAPHYRTALRNPLDSFYLYLQATGEEDISTDILQLHLISNSDLLAFHTTVYVLQGGGRDRLKLNRRYVFTPAEINADAGARDLLLRELKSEHSLGLIWLKKLGIVETTAPIDKASSISVLSLLKAFPWLDLHKDVPDFLTRKNRIVNDLIRANRLDLLIAYPQRDLSFEPGDGTDPPSLHFAAAMGNLEAVKFLLDRGQSTDARDNAGATALLIAIQHGQQAIVEHLLGRGADANLANAKGLTPLGAACTKYASQSGPILPSPLLVAALLKHGAKADGRSLGDELPLHRALADGGTLALSESLADVIVKGGGSLSLLGRNVVSHQDAPTDALFAALFVYRYLRNQDRQWLPIFKKLVQWGADPNALYDGKTCLHYAALWNDLELGRELVAAGASPVMVSKDGVLPATLAYADGARALGDVLLPAAGFRRQARVRMATDWAIRGLVGALGLLAMWPSAGIVEVLGPGNELHLLAVYACALVDFAGIGAVLCGSWADLADDLRPHWLRYLVGGLLAFPAAGLAVSSGIAALLKFPDGVIIAGHPNWNWAFLLVSMVPFGAAVARSFRYSARTSLLKQALAALDVVSAPRQTPTPTPPTPGFTPAPAFVPRAPARAQLPVGRAVKIVARFAIWIALISLLVAVFANQGQLFKKFIQANGPASRPEHSEAASATASGPAAARESAHRSVYFPELHKALESKLEANPTNLVVSADARFLVITKGLVRLADGCELPSGVTLEFTDVRLKGAATAWQPEAIDVVVPGAFCNGTAPARILNERSQFAKLEIRPASNDASATQRGVSTPQQVDTAALRESPARPADAVLTIASNAMHKVASSQVFEFPAGVKFIEPTLATRSAWESVKLSTPSVWVVTDPTQCLPPGSSPYHWVFAQFPCDSEVFAVPLGAVNQITTGSVLPNGARRFEAVTAIKIRRIQLIAFISPGTKLYRAEAPVPTPAEFGYQWPASLHATWFTVDPAACKVFPASPSDCSQPIPLTDAEWKPLVTGAQ